MRKLLLTLLACFSLASFKVSALTLEDARARGFVCEGNNGLLTSMGTPSPEVQQLINTINTQRNQEYQNIQRQTGGDLPTVMSTAAQGLKAKVPAGTYIMDANGKCHRK